MSKSRLTLRILAFVVFALASGAVTQAQVRTWVSGVGDDLNPCSRTAPCKTYSKAHSVTSAGGEISTLDPGGYGSVTITKSITIEGTKGQGYGSIVAAGTNGITVNDSGVHTIVVRLRNLSINGVGSGTNGIRFISGKSLHVEDCQIANFRAGTGRGIDVAFTSGTGQLLTVKDSFIRDNLGEGIRLSHTGVGGAVNASIENTRFDRNNIGITVSQVSVANIKNSFFSFNTAAGVRVENASSSANVENSFIQGSPSDGIRASAGNVRLSGNHITNNGVAGVNCTGGGTISSYGDNKMVGNAAAIVTCANPLPPLQKN